MPQKFLSANWVVCDSVLGIILKIKHTPLPPQTWIYILSVKVKQRIISNF